MLLPLLALVPFLLQEPAPAQPDEPEFVSLVPA
jgi:hypothetical protein